MHGGSRLLPATRALGLTLSALLALLGLVIVAGIIALGVQQGTSIMNLKDFDPRAPKVYAEMAKTLI